MSFMENAVEHCHGNADIQNSLQQHILLRSLTQSASYVCDKHLNSRQCQAICL